MKGDTLLSIVILAENEGYFAHKTMRCLFDALDNLREKINYEIIINLKNANSITKEYFSRYKKDERIILSGDTRKDISGKFVIVLESGSVFSNNIIQRALEKREMNGVFLPESIIYDGKRLSSNILKESFEDRGLKILLGKTWGANFFCRVDLIDMFMEDVLDRDSVARFWFRVNDARIPFEVLPEVSFFCKSKLKSKIILSKTELKYREEQQVLNNNKGEEEKKESNLRKAYVKLRNNKYAATILNPVGRKINQIRGKNNNESLNKSRIPQYLYNNWVEANTYDCNLYPSSEILAGLTLDDDLISTDAMGILNNFLAKIDVKYDYVFMVPWVVRGGGDKVLLNYIKALNEIFPKWKILVVSTEASSGEWVKNIPKNVGYLDFGKYKNRLSYESQNKIMERIVVQSQTKKIHIINSGFAYDWIYHYKDFLKKHDFEVYISFFCYDFVPGTDYKWLVEFSDPYIIKNYDIIKKIFTDNKAIVDFDTKRNGFDAEKFSVHYQPINDDFKKPILKKKEKIRILWAGRIADQKLPCILREIGRTINPEKFQIDVYGYIYDDYPKDYFLGCPGINYCGEYDGFASLDTEKYDMLLYTSVIDGLPNVLLEAVAAGLPIVASNAGGIKELIKDGKSGLLVDDLFNAKEYIDVIKKMSSDAQKSLEYATNAQEILKKRHSWYNFVKTIKKEFLG